MLLTLAAMFALSATAQDTTAVIQPRPVLEKPAAWTLQQCIDYAKQQNITIKKNRVNVRSAQLDLQDAKNARLPEVSFSTSQNISNRPFQKNTAVVNGSQVITSSSKTSYSGNYGINGSMTLYNGGRTKNNIKLQEINTQIAQLAVDASELNIEEQITQLFVQILYSQETIKQDEEQITLAQKQVDRAKALFKAGLLNKADVSQLESQLATDKYQLVADQTALDETKLQIKQLLELDGDENFEVAITSVDDDVLAPLPAKADVYAAALNWRPEIKSQLLYIDRSDIDEQLARADSKPTINLSAGISTNNMTGNGNIFTQLKDQWSNGIGVSLTLPIYDHGKTRNAIEKARLEKENYQLNLIDTQKSLWKTIEGYWHNANSAQQRYIAAREKVKYARTSYELTSEQFRLGLKNIMELMTDMTNLTVSTQQMLQAKYMEVLNAALLKYYQGETINL